MSRTTLSPDAAQFPRLRLLWPAALLSLLYLVGWGGSRLGHAWDLDGDGAVLFYLMTGTTFVGLFTCVLNLVAAVPALRRHPSLRTVGNLASTGVAAVFALFALYLVVHILYFAQ